MLSDITPTLRKIVYQQELSAEEARKALNLIGNEDTITDPQNSDGMYFTALTFGIMAKGPTAEELYGFVLSLKDNSVSFSVDIDPGNITDISGTGGDAVKTLNVGTTASFVISSAGAYVAKQATRAYTSLSGSADVFKELGIDVFTYTDINKVQDCLKKVGLVAFYTPAFSEKFKKRIDFLTKLRTIGLAYPTPWHLISWAYSPLKMDTRVYGVFSEKYLSPLAGLFIKLGYRKGMVVHGVDGLDEVSNIGPTKVSEFEFGQIKEYIITPEDLGVRKASREDIESHDREESIINFFRVLYGKEKGPKRDIVAVNAGASLYTLGKSKTLREGVQLAISLIDSGASAQKLEDYVAFNKTGEKLELWKKKSQV